MITPIRDKLLTPKIMASRIEWDQLEQSIVISVMKDGNVLISSSYMTDKELAYLSTQFQAFVMRQFHPENRMNER